MIAPTLVGEKITLRNLEKIDAMYSRKWSRNPRIDRFLICSWGNATDAEEEKIWKEMQESDSRMAFAIDENSSGKHIGNCDIKFEFAHEKCEVGIVIGDESTHGKGYGTEIMSMLRDYAFKQHKIHRVFLHVFAHNPRAKRCYEKCGFLLEGTERDYAKKGKKFISGHIMGILKPEWKKITNNGKDLAYSKIIE